MPLPEFLRKVRETQGQRSKEFLESLLDQDLEPNFRPKSPCKCPNLAKIGNQQEAKPAIKHKASTSNSSQGRQNTNDNIPITVRNMQVQAQK